MSCLLSLMVSATAARADTPAPNIVLLILDDVGIGEIQWHPEATDLSQLTRDTNEPIQTPNLFALASDGLRFTNYHSPAPTCSPSRAALLTGRYPQEFNVRDYLSPETRRGLPAGIATIATQLRASGYRTAHVGKWHVGDAFPEQMPTHFGFDEAWTRFGNEITAPYRNTVFVVDDDLAGKASTGEGKHSAEEITDRAIDFIERAEAADEPYFLQLAYRSVHLPLDPPANFPKLTAPNRKTASDWGITWANFVAGTAMADMAYLQNHSATPDAKQRAMFLAMLTWLDFQIGRITQRINELDPTGNTLLVIIGDNGPPGRPFATGSGSVPATWQPNGALKGVKRSAFEGGLRTPMLVHWPAGIQDPGKLRSGLVTGYDLMPTLLAAANASEPSTVLDGESLLATITDDSASMTRSAPVVWENRWAGGFWGGQDLITTLDDEQNNYAVWDDLRQRKLVTDRNGPDATDRRVFSTTGLGPEGLLEDQTRVASDVTAAEPVTRAALENIYREWRHAVTTIPHAYLGSTTADVLGQCLDFIADNDVAMVESDERFDILDGDFTFQTHVELDNPPPSTGVTIANQPGVWSVTVAPSATPGVFRANLFAQAQSNSSSREAPIPGDVLNLKSFFTCPQYPCAFNLAFTALGYTHAETGVRLYIDGSLVDEYVGNANDELDLRAMMPITGPLSLGNAPDRTKAIQGRLIDPQFSTSAKTPAEISGTRSEQAGVVCETGGCHP